MSEAVRQFVELARTTTLANEPGQAPKKMMYQMYCEYCRELMWHELREEGRDEVYSCLKCGFEQRFTVR